MKVINAQGWCIAQPTIHPKSAAVQPCRPRALTEVEATRNSTAARAADPHSCPWDPQQANSILDGLIHVSDEGAIRSQGRLRMRQIYSLSGCRSFKYYSAGGTT